jgi:hypothetical protein
MEPKVNSITFAHYETLARELQVSLKKGDLNLKGEIALGRILFFLAIESDKYLDEAVAYFDSLIRRNPNMDNLRMYAATLLALQARQATWPLHKYQLVNRSMGIMDEILARNPQDLEIRFLRAAVMYHLPSVFGKQQAARADLRYVFHQLPTSLGLFTAELLDKFVNFLLLTHEVFSEPEKEQMRDFKAQMMAPVTSM